MDFEKTNYEKSRLPTKMVPSCGSCVSYVDCTILKRVNKDTNYCQWSENRYKEKGK
jgi:hypothetical protein